MNDTATTPDAQREPEPVAAAERLGNLDLIRGIAVLGILAANIVIFGQPEMAATWPGAWVGPTGDPGNWWWTAQYVLVDGKMRGLFSLLFGVGLVIFTDKATARGETMMLPVRRLVILLVFGLLHFFFIWRGDILTLYAVCGLIALAFIQWPALNLLVLGTVGYLFGGIMYFADFGLPWLAMQGEGENVAYFQEAFEAARQASLEDRAVEQVLLTTGSYADWVRHSFAAHLGDPLGLLRVNIFETLPLMLIGAGLYRAGLFSGTFAPRLQTMVGWGAIAIGTAATAWIALEMRAGDLDYWGSVAAVTAFGHYPRLPVIIGLAALLAVYGEAAKGWLAERLSAAGRAAFTNYIGTSILMVLFFHPWAGAKWGEMTRPELYLVVVLGWAAMLWWSRPWLDRYRYGPLEWLWRCLTYGKRFPLRR